MSSGSNAIRSVASSAALFTLAAGVLALGGGGPGAPAPGGAALDSILDARHGAPPAPRGTPGFVNWESAHVHPLELTPDRTRLLAVNTPDNRLEVFDITGPGPVLTASIPVGVDPVSVRARTNGEAWVVNHVGDNVSVVDLNALHVIATLRVADEPADVAFAGGKAFVTCMTTSQVFVFNTADLNQPPTILALEGNEPRSLAVSPDGARVFAAFFRSGNGTTVLGGGIDPNIANRLAFPPNVVNHPSGPYGGVNPPPNVGTTFVPPINPALGGGLPVSLIVKRRPDGRWFDDNTREWTNLVTGPNAPLSGRPVGWELVDHDVAIIDPATLATTYAGGMLNINMGLAVNPASGLVTVVGTDALNHVRYEPVINGVFLRVNMGAFDPAAPAGTSAVDLNPHLTYQVRTLPREQRDHSLGDPRAIVWTADGTTAYVAGMGSNNVAAVAPSGARLLPRPIDVPEGPTGLALDEATGRLFVLSKFAAALSVIDTSSGVLVSTSEFFDPTPAAIKAGRKHLYDTRKNSGLGYVSCASCHVDGRTDRLAWDLGDPSANKDPVAGNNLGQGLTGLAPGSTQPAFADFHPMKGPMTTQTLQDIIGKEPHHWRGDRRGIEAFAHAFIGLQGNDVTLTTQEMQEFEDFLASIHFPPNPYRNLDNSLPTNLPLPGHFTTGRFSPPGNPLPNGSAARGLGLYRSPARRLDGNAFACVTCHTLPTGAGTDHTLVGNIYTPIPPGPMGERHLALVTVDGTTNISTKVPQFRNAYQKGGFNTTRPRNTAGFGFLHDGSVDSIERFVSEPVFTVRSDQEVADLVAFSLALSGSDLPPGSPTSPLEPPGPLSQDSHAAVGTQLTLIGPPTAQQNAVLTTLLTQANQQRIGLVARATSAGRRAGHAYAGNNTWNLDLAGASTTHAALLASASPASPVVVTAVHRGTQARLGLDRDGDGWFDGDELAVCTDPADPARYPGGPGSPDANGDLFIDFFDLDLYLANFEQGLPEADFNQDGFLDFFDLDAFLEAFERGCD
ncbi:MAG: YncE family protein [Phycisphaeraceae bacterium]|nr:MAG: YncE family protein [Phycisphaeraceae bacterium]